MPLVFFIFRRDARGFPNFAYRTPKPHCFFWDQSGWNEPVENLFLYRMDLRKKAMLVNSCQGKNRGAASCFGLLMSGVAMELFTIE
jgi:hypothetical protein